jgi:hypothetical protein
MSEAGLIFRNWTMNNSRSSARGAMNMVTSPEIVQKKMRKIRAKRKDGNRSRDPKLTPRSQIRQDRKRAKDISPKTIVRPKKSSTQKIQEICLKPLTWFLKISLKGIHLRKSRRRKQEWKTMIQLRMQ